MKHKKGRPLFIGISKLFLKISPLQASRLLPPPKQHGPNLVPVHFHRSRDSQVTQSDRNVRRSNSGLRYHMETALIIKLIGMKFINNMLANRTFQLTKGNERSKQMKLNNGFPRGCLLVPHLSAFLLPTRLQSNHVILAIVTTGPLNGSPRLPDCRSYSH